VLTFVESLVQDAYDMGLRNKSKIAEMIGVSRKSITRAVQAGKIEYYEPFDEGWGVVDVPLVNCEESMRELLGIIISESLRESSLCIDEYAEDASFDQFTRSIYGDIKSAIKNEGETPYLSCIHLTCRRCGNIKELSRYNAKRGGSLGISRVCSDCLYEDYVNNPRRLEWAHKRRAIKKNLPSISYQINKRCNLTDTTIIAHDHFIPLDTGHGGTYLGNMIPLCHNLNNKKNRKHPYEWFEANRQRFNLEQSRFDAVVADLAEQNGLTPVEYRQYVDWCYENKRSLDDIIADNKRYGYVVTSVELWREATRRHFPLRFDNREQTYVADNAA